MHQREAERGELIRILQGRQSIQMLAPRRVGKTWLMRRVAEDLDRRGWATVFIDVEGMKTEGEVLRALCRAIEAKANWGQWVTGQLTQRLKQIVAGGFEGNPADALARIDAKSFCEALVASLNQQDAETLILIDEIAQFVSVLMAQGEAGARDFLYHLRRLRQAYPRVRWLLTGSVGLDVVARRASLLGALNDVTIFSLHPFDERAARAYLGSISANGEIRRPFALDDDGFAYFARELGWLSPYYLKHLANEVNATGDLVSGLPLARRSDIDAAFARLLHPDMRGYFAAWEEHIDKNFSKEDSDTLHRILDLACRDSQGETFATIQAGIGVNTPQLPPRDLRNLLTALDNGGFLHEVGERWRFRSGLLRRYWLRYMCA